MPSIHRINISISIWIKSSVHCHRKTEYFWYLWCLAKKIQFLFELNVEIISRKSWMVLERFDFIQYRFIHLSIVMQIFLFICHIFGSFGFWYRHVRCTCLIVVTEIKHDFHPINPPFCCFWCWSSDYSTFRSDYSQHVFHVSVSVLSQVLAMHCELWQHL